MHRSVVLLAVPAVLTVFAAEAQTFPVKPVRIIVGTAAGGGVDAISRITGARLAERWPHAIVVENRAGAGGAVASEFVAKSVPDGHTLLTISIAYSVIPSSHRNLGYDPIRDLAPVTVLVNAPKPGLKNFEDVVEAAAAQFAASKPTTEDNTESEERG